MLCLVTWLSMKEEGINNKTNRTKKVNKWWRRMNEEWRTKKNNKNDEFWSHRALPEMTKQIDDDKIDWTKNRRRKWAW